MSNQFYEQFNEENIGEDIIDGSIQL